MLLSRFADETDLPDWYFIFSWFSILSGLINASIFVKRANFQVVCLIMIRSVSHLINKSFLELFMW